MNSQKKSKLEKTSDSAKETVTSLMIRELNRKRRSAKKLYTSIKISLGLLASLLALLIASSAVLLISGLVWLSQNTALLPENVAIFLSGTVIGYIASVLIAILYLRYINSEDR